MSLLPIVISYFVLHVCAYFAFYCKRLECAAEVLLVPVIQVFQEGDRLNMFVCLEAQKCLE